MLRACQRYFLRKWVRDAMFVFLPHDVERCEVYRNVVSVEEEGRIYGELSRVLSKYGDVIMQENASVNAREVRHTYLEMYGHDKDFVQVKNWRRRETRQLPGLSWSPTLVELLRDMIAAKIVDMPLPDMARVVEYVQAGYEMHLEHPSCGAAYVYLNLLADTVFEFDDESTQRHGQVWLPARSLMVVSDELRWGFRVGEITEPVHTFITASNHKRVKEIETDIRLGIQLWKFTPNLVDHCLLEEELEEDLKAMKDRELLDAKMKLESKVRSSEFSERSKVKTHTINNDTTSNVELHDAEQAIDEAEAREVVSMLEERESNIFSNRVPEEYSEELEGSKNDGTDSSQSSEESALSSAMQMARGDGLLGGDLNLTRTNTSPVEASKSQLEQMKSSYTDYRHKVAAIQEVMEEITHKQKVGEPLDDYWMKQAVVKVNKDTIASDVNNGFDPGNIQKTWDHAEAKAKFYKEKLKKMDYDGTAFLNSRMPDVTNDAPLDMQSTIQKVIPLVENNKNRKENTANNVH